ncbi:MAG: hypothetical protein GXY55_04460 [Phycisphaerae bacterium]|nr:hypothetical protein [Phycisphaerae bacterium]
MEAELCQLRDETCYDWVIVCKESTNPPLVTAQEWADYVNVGYMVSDLDLRKDSWWEAECVPGAQCYLQESDWNLIADPWVRLHHWEFVGDPPDLTVPGSYTLKAVFTNDLIPDPIRCNPCWCPDGTEDCDECQRCPSTKVLNLDDPDVERLFTIWVVETEIIWPKQPITVEQGGALSESFLTDNGCYRQSNQAVVIGALGTNQPLARVEGKIDPSVLDPWWDIPSYLGDISHRDDEKPKDPGHIPPAVADHGGISFLGRYKKDPVCSDSVGITVYQDHLARDLANFFPGMRCGPASIGVELADGSSVSGITLSCGPAARHAAGGTFNYDFVPAYTYLGSMTWQQFLSFPLQYGDIIENRALAPNGGSFNLHWQTAKHGGDGAGVVTYAGDALGYKFFEETTLSRYARYWDAYHPYGDTFDGYPNKQSDFQRWLADRACVRVYRKP